MKYRLKKTVLLLTFVIESSHLVKVSLRVVTSGVAWRSVSLKYEVLSCWCHLSLQLNNFEIKPGKFLKVNASVANVRLFVGNIPKNRTRDEIFEEFHKSTGNVYDKFYVLRCLCLNGCVRGQPWVSHFSSFSFFISCIYSRKKTFGCKWHGFLWCRCPYCHRVSCVKAPKATIS